MSCVCTFDLFCSSQKDDRVTVGKKTSKMSTGFSARLNTLFVLHIQMRKRERWWLAKRKIDEFATRLTAALTINSNILTMIPRGRVRCTLSLLYAHTNNTCMWRNKNNLVYVQWRHCYCKNFLLIFLFVQLLRFFLLKKS